MILSKLALKNLRKRKTLVILFTLIIVATSIFSLLLLIASYKQYMINTVRNENNWELKISNLSPDVSFSKISNIKETSNVYYYDIMDFPSPNNHSYSLKLLSYDNNCFENIPLKITNGRLPKNPNEIVITSKPSDLSDLYIGLNNYNIGDIIKFESNNINKEFTIVGTCEDTPYNESTMAYSSLCAITYSDTQISQNITSKYSYILTDNIHDTYNIATQIADKLNISSENISYNEPLLEYSLVSTSSTNFKNTLYFIGITFLTVIIIVNFTLIYTAFFISLNSRKEEFGTLRSIGMTKTQIVKMIYLEIIILSIIAIILSFIISTGIVNLILNYINNILPDMKLHHTPLFLTPANNEIKLFLVTPINFILFAILFIIITIIISTILPIIRISNTTPISSIKRLTNSYSSKKKTKKAKFFKNLSIEHNLSYRYITQNKYKSLSIIISLSMCIILFIIVSNYITNIYARVSTNTLDYNYILYLDDNNSNEVISDLEKKNLIDCFYIKNSVKSLSLNITLDNLNDELLNFIHSDYAPSNLFYNPFSDKIPQLDCNVFTITSHKNYEDLLKQLNVSELKENECIFLNRINLPQFCDFKVTNYKPNNTLSLFCTNLKSQNASGLKDINLTINFVVDSLYEFHSYTNINDIYSSPIAILVNPKTLENIEKEINNQYSNFYNDESYNNISQSTQTAYITSTNPSQLEEYITSSTTLSGLNLQSEYKSEKDRQLIIGFLLYSFVGLIALSSIFNIFNIIYTNVQSRKWDFANLKSLGTSRKQINKILNRECFIYTTISIFIGITVGIVVFIIIYCIQNHIMNNFLFDMYISIPSIMLSILFVVVTVFVSMLISRHFIKYDDLIKTIKINHI